MSTTESLLPQQRAAQAHRKLLPVAAANPHFLEVNYDDNDNVVRITFHLDAPISWDTRLPAHTAHLIFDELGSYTMFRKPVPYHPNIDAEGATQLGFDDPGSRPIEAVDRIWLYLTFQDYDRTHIVRPDAEGFFGRGRAIVADDVPGRLLLPGFESASSAGLAPVDGAPNPAQPEPIRQSRPEEARSKIEIEPDRQGQPIDNRAGRAEQYPIVQPVPTSGQRHSPAPPDRPSSPVATNGGRAARPEEPANARAHAPAQRRSRGATEPDARGVRRRSCPAR